VLGEVYWKCEVGETTAVNDFTNGRDVLSREESPGEVQWSHSAPIAWPVIAQAFGLPPDGPQPQFAGHTQARASGLSTSMILLIVVVIILLICMFGACGTCMPSGGSIGGSRGGGIYYGGK
jgi:hypothetical protein